MSVRKKDANYISLSLPECKIKDGAFPLKWNNKPGKKGLLESLIQVQTKANV